MPRYYFNLCDGRSEIIDDEGVELLGWEAARCSAIEALHKMIQQKPPHEEELKLSCAVLDEVGTVVYTATMLFAGKNGDRLN